jgi:hypothetical protein
LSGTREPAVSLWGESTRSAFGALRELVERPAAVELCHFCSAAVVPDHAHLLEPGHLSVICVCDPCATLFGYRGQTRYRVVPRTTRALEGFSITDTQWDSLAIPIDLAFFVRSADAIAAFYPGPAGPVQSQVDLAAWNEIAAANPVLERLEPDVEALLVNRTRNAREYFIAPIDQCYRLVGLIRTHWRRFSGGQEAWSEIHAFFEKLRAGAVGDR